MIMKKTILLPLLSLVISLSAEASPHTPKSCPDPLVIQHAAYHVELDTSSDGKNVYQALQPEQNYGTEATWKFTVSGVKAESLKAAQKEITAVFASLTLEKGPDKAGSTWKCVYENGSHAVAEAVTG
jgi:hypothetical protein